MLYKFSFTPEYFCELISKNMECYGRKGKKRDIDLIYYYLTQKYTDTQIRTLLKKMQNVLGGHFTNAKDKGIFDRLCLLADNNRNTPKS